MFGLKSRRRLQLENAVMRAALLWYAAKETWRRKGIHQKGAPHKKWQKSPAAYDSGHGAIRALTLIDQKRVDKWSVTVPAPLAVLNVTEDIASCRIELPISSTASSTTSPPADAKSGWTADSADTQAATP
ncbi:MAG: hypothetical protein WA777_19670 [Rhodanobacter sp.]